MLEDKHLTQASQEKVFSKVSNIIDNMDNMSAVEITGALDKAIKEADSLYNCTSLKELVAFLSEVLEKHPHANVCTYKFLRLHADYEPENDIVSFS